MEAAQVRFNSPTAVQVIIVMGVAGSGKTTIGSQLAHELGSAFFDADQFHSAENKAKMAAGHPLTDNDREPWLAAMRSAVGQWVIEGQNTVLACSALKHNYRALLRVNDSVRFVYLKVAPEVLTERLERRLHHFMKGNMLESQFQTLEEPAEAEAVTVDAAEPVENVVRSIRFALGL